MAEPDPHGYENDLQSGLEATGILGAVRELVAAQQHTITTRLIALYRSGHTDHDHLLGSVAELKALDDFMRNCEALQTRGNVAAERMHRNAQ